MGLAFWTFLRRLVEMVIELWKERRAAHVR